MIKIRRGECPASLNKMEEEFKKNDYNNPDVKLKLLEMQHGKCCYCERDIRDLPETEREIDHYFPQIYFKNDNDLINWSKANSWDNLLYSCRKCNNTKRGAIPFNHETNEIQIINPANHDFNPQDHITFLVDDPFIFYVPHNESQIGKSTIENLKFIDRTDLLKDLKIARAEIDLLFTKLENSIINNDQIGLEELLKDLSKTTSSHKKFAAFSRFYINKRWKELTQNRIELIKGKLKITVDIPEIRICCESEVSI